MTAMVQNIYSQPVVIGRKQIAEEFNMSLGTVDARIKEIEEEYSKRYNAADMPVIRHGSKVLVNKLVLLDYLYYRERLIQKNLRKTVPPYDPYNTAKAFGIYNVIEEEQNKDELNEQIEQEVSVAIDKLKGNLVNTIAETLLKSV